MQTRWNQLVSGNYLEITRQRAWYLSKAEFERRLVECLKFIELKSLKGDNGGDALIPVTKSLDQFWHFLILETQYYEELCQRLGQGAFVHHSLGDAKESLNGPDRIIERLASDLSWLGAYVGQYGFFENNSSKYWSVVHHLRSHLGLSLHCINTIGKDVAHRFGAVPNESSLQDYLVTYVDKNTVLEVGIVQFIKNHIHDLGWVVRALISLRERIAR